MRRGVRATATDYLETFERLLRAIDLSSVERVVDRLREARDNGRTIYIAGNGGSAATATHWANDLGKAVKQSGRRPIRPISLSDNVSWLTALANDEGYTRAFAGQLENFAQPGDVLIVISASGSSPNLVKAVELAHSRGMVTVALVGFDGGALRGLVTDAIWVPTESGAYGLAESAQAVVADVITTCLIDDVTRDVELGPAAGLPP